VSVVWYGVTASDQIKKKKNSSFYKSLVSFIFTKSRRLLGIKLNRKQNPLGPTHVAPSHFLIISIRLSDRAQESEKRSRRRSVSQRSHSQYVSRLPVRLIRFVLLHARAQPNKHTRCSQVPIKTPTSQPIRRRKFARNIISRRLGGRADRALAP
jgi:hypothetical protein